jgi:CRISPR-associated endoribonuclease Cas6
VAVNDLALLVVALRRMAESGIGKSQQESESDGRGSRRLARAELALITTTDGKQAIFNNESGLVQATVEAAADALDRPTIGPTRAEIRLLSPLRIKRNGTITGRPSPTDFLVTLARRANALSVLFGKGAPAIDEREVEDMAAGIESETIEMQLVHVRRFSARQRAKMEWPGVIGTLVWRSPALGELWPLLRFGELVQVGKGTALGFGRYVLRSGDEASAVSASQVR